MLAETHADVIGATQIARFQREGFLLLPGLLRMDDIRVLRGAMDEALRTLEQSPNSYNVTAAADALWCRDIPLDDQGSCQHDLGALAEAIRKSSLPRLLDAPSHTARGRFLLDTGIWHRVKPLARFARNSALPSIASALLGASRVRFYDDQLFVKEPGAIDRAAFHQDLSYFHLSGNSGCVFWIPLTAVSASCGRMGYIPGSHRWGSTYKPNVFVSAMPFPGSEGADMPAINEQPEAFGVHYVDVKPGDVIAHHFLTVHGSEGNRGTTTRSAFSLRYCDAKMKYRYRQGAPTQPHHRPDMHNGDELDDELHPLV